MTPQERALEAVREFSEEPWQVSASSGIVSVVTRHIAAAVAEECERCAKIADGGALPKIYNEIERVWNRACENIARDIRKG